LRFPEFVQGIQDLAVLHDAYPVGDVKDVIDAVRDEQDRHALRFHDVQDAQDPGQVGLTFPLMIMPSEDFPAPCSPTTAWTLEGERARLTSFSASIWP
jgi:hypothetical protein